MNKFAIFNDNSIYRLRLLSDQDLINKAVMVYDSTQLANNELTLDSGIFGSNHNGECVLVPVLYVHFLLFHSYPTHFQHH